MVQFQVRAFLLFFVLFFPFLFFSAWDQQRTLGELASLGSAVVHRKPVGCPGEDHTEHYSRLSPRIFYVLVGRRHNITQHSLTTTSRRGVSQQVTLHGSIDIVLVALLHSEGQREVETVGHLVTNNV